MKKYIGIQENPQNSEIHMYSYVVFYYAHHFLFDTIVLIKYVIMLTSEGEEFTFCPFINMLYTLKRTLYLCKINILQVAALTKVTNT